MFCFFILILSALLIFTKAFFLREIFLHATLVASLTLASCTGPSCTDIFERTSFVAQLCTLLYGWRYVSDLHDLQNPLPEVAPGKIAFAGSGQPTTIKELPFYDKEAKLEIDKDKFKAMQKINKAL